MKARKKLHLLIYKSKGKNMSRLRRISLRTIRVFPGSIRSTASYRRSKAGSR
jgi:hypothetical protein